MVDGGGSVWLCVGERRVSIRESGDGRLSIRRNGLGMRLGE